MPEKNAVLRIVCIKKRTIRKTAHFYKTVLIF